MSFIQCNFFSETLNLATSMNVIIPQLMLEEREKYGDNRKFQTLYLLHGYSDDHTAWTRYTSIERYANEKKLAVIMPAVDHSWYTDMAQGKNYWTYISEEIPRIARSLFPLSDKREDNFVAGLSMGGYGAFKLALSKPEFFAAAASLSGALDITDRAKLPNAEAVFKNVFEDLSSIKGSNNDILYLLEGLKKNNKNLPKLFQCCGTEDFLYEINNGFRKFAEELSVELTYKEGPGTHEWGYWDENIKAVLEWLPLKKQPV